MWTVLLVLWCGWISPANAGTVTLSGATLHEVLETQESPEPASDPVVAHRWVRLERLDDGVRISAVWRVEARKPGWFRGRVIGPTAHVSHVSWGGKPANLVPGGEGFEITGWVDGVTELELDAVVPGAWGREAVDLHLLGAVVGVVDVEGDATDLGLEGGGEDGPIVWDGARWWTGREGLRLRARPLEAPSGPSSLVIGRVGVGLTVGDGSVTGRARVVYEVRRGTLERLSLRVEGIGSDLEITGPRVRGWTLRGDRVEVELHGPVSDRVELEASWTVDLAGTAEARVGVPRVEPEGVFRLLREVQIARDTEAELGPRLGGWTPISGGQLSEVGSGLVEGRPVAAYRGGVGADGGVVEVFRFVPVEAPPLWIDDARVEVVTTFEGRALMRATYEVRNERAASLRWTPPEGMRIIGARVNGVRSHLAGNDRDGWTVPLVRSLETLEGMVSFPVQILALGEIPRPEELRTLAVELPRVSAPVAVSTVRVFLPPGVRSKTTGSPGIVFDRMDDATRAVIKDAVVAWRENDFRTAQEKLDLLGAVGVEHDDVARLQSNLDAVSGRRDVEVTAKMAQRRKVFGRAQARAVEQVQAQAEVERAAEEALMSGEYAKAKAHYERALEIGQVLEMLEDESEVEAASRNESYRRELSALDELVADSEIAFGASRGATKSFESTLRAGGAVVSGGLAGGGEKPSALGFASEAFAGRPVPPPEPSKSGAPASGTPDELEETEGPAFPVVSASALSVILPEVGETVDFQRRLIPADDSYRVVLRVRPPRRRHRGK